MCSLRLAVVLIILGAMPFSVIPQLADLEHCSWQSVAGIAQILAAVFAAVTICQARKTIIQADEERKLSVAPDWDVAKVLSPNIQRGKQLPDRKPFRIEFVNSGLGPAREIAVAFTPHNGNRPLDVTWKTDKRTAVQPEHLLFVTLGLGKDSPLDGSLFIQCMSRFGQRVENEFHVRTGAFKPRGIETSVERVPQR